MAVAGARAAQLRVEEAALGAEPKPLRQHRVPDPL